MGANIGRLVEDMENKIRNTLNEIYFGKTKDIVNGLRSVQPLAEANSQVVLQKQLLAKLNEERGRGKWELIEDILPTLHLHSVDFLFVRQKANKKQFYHCDLKCRHCGTYKRRTLIHKYR